MFGFCHGLQAGIKMGQVNSYSVTAQPDGGNKSSIISSDMADSLEMLLTLLTVKASDLTET
jgi:hypothetical protein